MTASSIMSGEPFGEEKRGRIRDALHRDGFVQIPGVLQAREIEALRNRTR